MHSLWLACTRFKDADRGTVVSCSCVRKASPSWLHEPAHTLHPCRLGALLQRCLKCNNGQAEGVLTAPNNTACQHEHTTARQTFQTKFATQQYEWLAGWSLAAKLS